MRRLFCAVVLASILGGCEDEPDRKVQEEVQKEPDLNEKDEPTSSELDTVKQSEALLKSFPLFPVVEKKLWSDLLESEKDSSLEARKRSEEIADALRELHPFYSDEKTVSLGAVSYHKDTGVIEIPAKVSFPKLEKGQDSTEIELILSHSTGRDHETLFVTDARPLHLEMLLHLTGYKKQPQSRFRAFVSIPNHELIPIDSLLRDESGNKLSNELTWLFSGSEFTDVYSPDQTGDLIICWQCHDSVLSVGDSAISEGTQIIIAQRHPELEQGLPVRIVLKPVK